MGVCDSKEGIYAEHTDPMDVVFCYARQLVFDKSKILFGTMPKLEVENG